MARAIAVLTLLVSLAACSPAVLERTQAFGVTTQLDMFTSEQFASQMRAEQADGAADDRADLVLRGVPRDRTGRARDAVRHGDPGNRRRVEGGRPPRPRRAPRGRS